MLHGEIYVVTFHFIHIKNMLKQNTTTCIIIMKKCTNPLPTWEEVLEGNSRAIIHHLSILEMLVSMLHRRVDSLEVEGVTCLLSLESR